MSAAIPDAVRPAGGRRPGTPLLALASGGLSGVLETVLAERCGMLRFATARSGGWGVELATLTWLSAVSVVVGVLIAARFGRPVSTRRLDPFAVGAAAFGGLFAVPLTTSSVAWAAIYGGAVPAYRAALHVVLGVVLGALAGLLAQRYRSVAVGLLVGSGVIWLVALVSAQVGADHSPVLGHPDLGLDAGSLGQRIGALALALLIGAGFGAVGPLRRARARLVAAVASPALVAATYLTAMPVTGGDWSWSPLPTALLAVPCAALGATLATRCLTLANTLRSR